MGVNLFSKNNKHILQYIIADVDLKDCKDCKKKLFFHLYNSHSKKYIPIIYFFVRSCFIWRGGGG